MTLADFLRRYLEDRRKVCEEKARSLDLGRNVQYFTKNEENVDSSENASPKYFSNTLDKTPKKNKTIKKGKTTVIRWVKRPDGGGQVETTIKDGKGNEEKRVTYLEDGKKYTIITRTDPSGKKQVEQQVTDAVNWYNKFFKPSQPPSQEFWKNDVMPFDSKNEEEIINNLIKVFENDSFAGAFKNLWPPSENKDDEWFAEDFTPRNDIFNEEMQKFMEQFEIDARKLHKNKREFGDRSVDYDLNTQVDSAMKNFITTKSPSLFEQFAERAVVELPEEKTPFDKFIEPDEETQKKRLSIYKEREEFMKKLDNFFNQDASNEDKHVVYSDIAPSQDQDLAIFVPRLEPPMNFNDFGGIIAKHFGSNNANLRFSSTSKIKLPNGKIRTETVSRDEKGNMEKSVTYQAGNKTFNVVTVTSPSGEQIKRQKDMNFPRDELPSFKNQWDKQFQSDFSD